MNTLVINLQEAFVLGTIIVLSSLIFIIFIKFTRVVASIFLIDSSFTMLHIILEIAGLSVSILVEISVPDIKLSFDVIILPFSVFHAVVELAFIPLFISVGQSTSALEFTIDHSLGSLVSMNELLDELIRSLA